MKNAYSEQGSFEIEQQLGRNTTLSVGYQHVRGLHLIISVNQNVPSCAAVGTNDGCRPNLNYGNDSQYSSLADSHYDGAMFRLLQRPVKWGNLPGLVHLFEGSRQRERVLLQRAHQQLQYLAGLRHGRTTISASRLALDGTIHSALEKANTAWERISHGFQLSYCADGVLSAAV